MVNIEEGFAYITSGTASGNTISGGITVKVAITKIDNDIEKVIDVITPGVSPDLQDKRPSAILILDLNKNNQAFTIYGMLEHDTGDTIFNKRDNFEILSGLSTATPKGGPVTFVYNNNTVQYKRTDCYIRKAKISETSEKSQKQPLQKMPVVITLVRGTGLG